MKKYGLHIFLILLLGIITLLISAQDQPSRGGQQQTGTFCTEVPARSYDIVLARPTRDSVTISILAYKDFDGYIVYGTKPGGYTLQTPLQTFAKDKPNEIVLRKLLADTRYYYQLRIRPAVGAQLTTSPEYTFHTQRVPGEAYTFTITADSHLDERTTPSLYLQTMHNALADKPDFHIDLGDTFMTEKYPSRDSAAKQYLAQRYYFGQLCHSAPLYLVIGNHDGETVKEQDGTANSLAVWSATMRKTYFPNPVPDTFYTGNETKNQLAGDLQDYYAWTWGDAQFIMLDPYWFTPSQRGGNDNWTRTLGNTQYQWLTKTLENSKSKYKFVFIHHLVGGLGKDARGGIEAAPFYEWGGKNTDGTDGFAAHRPGWTMPIHQLLLKNHVSAVFHGHDHLFAKQELDGIIYQEVPQPGWQGRYDSRRATEYGYEKGEILGSSGHLRLTVSGKETKVEYVSAMLPTDENNTRKNGMVVSSYFVMP